MKATLTQQLAAFKNGQFMDSDGETDTDCFTFFDWFCKDKALKGKAEKLFPMVERFVKKRNIDTDKVYVFFKNNCPVFGPLYDDFRIVDRETENVIYTVTPKSGHTGTAEVWGRENNFQQAIAVGKNLNEIYKNWK